MNYNGGSGGGVGSGSNQRNNSNSNDDQNLKQTSKTSCYQNSRTNTDRYSNQLINI
jgi:hypothetical protein